MSKIPLPSKRTATRSRPMSVRTEPSSSMSSIPTTGSTETLHGDGVPRSRAPTRYRTEDVSSRSLQQARKRNMVISTPAQKNLTKDKGLRSRIDSPHIATRQTPLPPSSSGRKETAQGRIPGTNVSRKPANMSFTAKACEALRKKCEQLEEEKKSCEEELAKSQEAHHLSQEEVKSADAALSEVETLMASIVVQNRTTEHQDKEIVLEKSHAAAEMTSRLKSLKQENARLSQECLELEESVNEGKRELRTLMYLISASDEKKEKAMEMVQTIRPQLATCVDDIKGTESALMADMRRLNTLATRIRQVRPDPCIRFVATTWMAAGPLKGRTRVSIQRPAKHATSKESERLSKPGVHQATVTTNGHPVTMKHGRESVSWTLSNGRKFEFADILHSDPCERLESLIITPWKTLDIDTEIDRSRKIGGEQENSDARQELSKEELPVLHRQHVMIDAGLHSQLREEVCSLIRIVDHAPANNSVGFFITVGSSESNVESLFWGTDIPRRLELMDIVEDAPEETESIQVKASPKSAHNRRRCSILPGSQRGTHVENNENSMEAIAFDSSLAKCNCCHLTPLVQELLTVVSPKELSCRHHISLERPIDEHEELKADSLHSREAHAEGSMRKEGDYLMSFVSNFKNLAGDFQQADDQFFKKFLEDLDATNPGRTETNHEEKENTKESEKELDDSRTTMVASLVDLNHWLQRIEEKSSGKPIRSGILDISWKKSEDRCGRVLLILILHDRAKTEMAAVSSFCSNARLSHETVNTLMESVEGQAAVNPIPQSANIQATVCIHLGFPKMTEDEIRVATSLGCAIDQHVQ